MLYGEENTLLHTAFSAILLVEFIRSLHHKYFYSRGGGLLTPRIIQPNLSFQGKRLPALKMNQLRSSLSILLCGYLYFTYLISIFSD